MVHLIEQGIAELTRKSILQKDSKEKHSLKEFYGYVSKRVDYDFKPPFWGKIFK
ncbi:hypothetical protein [Ureibacillus sp. FSL W8-0352]|uniref:hypothetical protein n=1 Tax=Ureibacillus sp. FSL W8-0352 TaxID=2954596 RepID=UPI0030FB9B2E